MSGRSSSISTQMKGWVLGRALTKPARFSDLLHVISHTGVLDRCLKKMVADSLVTKDNAGLYLLTAKGIAWREAMLPLLKWTDANRRHQPVQHVGNDPVGGRRDAVQ
jgi:DNA-binding HxlR family transcriptional regulator